MNNYETDFLTKQKRLLTRNEGCRCSECNLLFTVDLIIEDSLWNVIKPETGILCGSCIMRRIEVESSFYAFKLVDIVNPNPKSEEIMKLSEAIRQGSRLRPQAFGRYTTQEKSSGQIVAHSCVVVAAAEGATGSMGDTTNFVEWFWRTDHLLLNCPDCGKTCQGLKNLSIHLNDGHRWKRSRIADYVESLGF